MQISMEKEVAKKIAQFCYPEREWIASGDDAAYWLHEPDENGKRAMSLPWSANIWADIKAAEKIVSAKCGLHKGLHVYAASLATTTQGQDIEEIDLNVAGIKRVLFIMRDCILATKEQRIRAMSAAIDAYLDYKHE